MKRIKVNCYNKDVYNDIMCVLYDCGDSCDVDEENLIIIINENLNEWCEELRCMDDDIEYFIID